MNPSELLIEAAHELLERSEQGSLASGIFEVIRSPREKDLIRLFKNQRPNLAIVVSPIQDSTNGLDTAAKIQRHNNRNIPIFLFSRQIPESYVLTSTFIPPYKKINKMPGILSRMFPSPLLAMIGKSRSIREINQYLLKIAKTDSTVLITGETGTGKELAAEVIYKNSIRRNQPFISVNCTAMPDSLVESELFGHEKGAFTGAGSVKKGKFELANKGTLFLDEIGDMSIVSQAKILRAIEKKEIYRLGGKWPIKLDFRLIAATNKNPEDLVEAGAFRNDLFYRLNIARIDVPPLRERKEDIEPLTNHFINKMKPCFDMKIKGFTKETEKILQRYDWPGNVRELKNIIEASFINLESDNTTLLKLPGQIYQQLNRPPAPKVKERCRIVAALLETKWNKSKAAQRLKWSRMTVYRKMTQYNIIQKRNPER